MDLLINFLLLAFNPLKKFKSKVRITGHTVTRRISTLPEIRSIFLYLSFNSIKSTSLAQFFKILKVVLLLLIIVMIYFQIIDDGNKIALQEVLLGKRPTRNLTYIGLCILMMPINWWLESKKWQWLMSPHVEISSRQAIKTVLAGVAAGIMTPARLGEYGGRLVTTDPLLKAQVVSATLLGSIAQNICNVAVGLGFSYFFLKSVFGVTFGEGLTFSIVVAIQIIVLIFLYYNLPKVAHYVERVVRVKYVTIVSQKLKSLDLYQSNLLNKVLVLSLLRYAIYFTQYLLILVFLGVSLNIGTLFGNISGIYMIQTGIPLPAFLSVFARGELAILIWSSVGIDEMTALAATIGLWFINLIIPTIAGIIILTGTDLKKYFNKNE